MLKIPEIWPCWHFDGSWSVSIGYNLADATTPIHEQDGFASEDKATSYGHMWLRLNRLPPGFVPQDAIDANEAMQEDHGKDAAEQARMFEEHWDEIPL